MKSQTYLLGYVSVVDGLGGVAGGAVVVLSSVGGCTQQPLTPPDCISATFSAGTKCSFATGYCR